jgi:hypothetical protein
MAGYRGLAFFADSHFIVYAKYGGILSLPSGRRAEEMSLDEFPEGYARVTRDELFERWPEWRAEYEQLERKLAEEGFA